jgi:hypothetical protein
MMKGGKKSEIFVVPKKRVMTGEGRGIKYDFFLKGKTFHAQK